LETSRQRILEFIEKQSIKPKDFLLKTGLKKGFVDKSHINSGISDIYLSKILESYPEINPTWLLTGKGERLLEIELDRVYPNAHPKPDGIPLIPLDAMAGFGNGSAQIMDYDTDRYVVPEFTELDVDFMIRVKGSSMFPKYNSGDLVACKKLSLSDVFFQWNKVYVLDTDQGAIVKRIKPGDDEEHITLKSENEDYDPFQIHRSRINAIALVVGVIRLE